jgi:hypothetical protein
MTLLHLNNLAQKSTSRESIITLISNESIIGLSENYLIWPATHFQNYWKDLLSLNQFLINIDVGETFVSPTYKVLPNFNSVIIDVKNSPTKDFPDSYRSNEVTLMADFLMRNANSVINVQSFLNCKTNLNEVLQNAPIGPSTVILDKFENFNARDLNVRTNWIYIPHCIYENGFNKISIAHISFFKAAKDFNCYFLFSDGIVISPESKIYRTRDFIQLFIEIFEHDRFDLIGLLPLIDNNESLISTMLFQNSELPVQGVGYPLVFLSQFNLDTLIATLFDGQLALTPSSMSDSESNFLTKLEKMNLHNLGKSKIDLDYLRKIQHLSIFER